MADRPQIYTRGKIYVDSVLLAEESSITVQRSTQSTPMHSTVKGYSGETPGSPMLELTVESNVPNAGFELQPSNFSELGFVEMVVELEGGTILPFEAFIYQDNFQHAINSGASFTFNARAKAVAWQ